MHPHATYDLLSHPPWTKSLDRVVFMTWSGKVRTPFHSYVRRNSIPDGTSQSFSTFWIFPQLPEEIQLHILAMCSASTLFQLMHVSSKLRVEASKLFWGKQDVCFLVPFDWLLDEAYPGDTSLDMAFLSQVRNIEVEEYIESSRPTCRNQDGVLDVQGNLISGFWTAIKATFPKVKKVILNHNYEKPSLDNNSGLPPLAPKLLLQACPQGIECSVLILEKKGSQHDADASNTRTPMSWQRTLYRQTPDGGLDKGEPEKQRKTILAPPKRFQGPIGTFKEVFYQGLEVLSLQVYGLWPLVVEAINRHHFDIGRNESFACPISDCRHSFSQAGEWTAHAAEVHFREYNIVWPKLLEAAPGSAGTNLRQRSQAIEREYNRIDRILDRKKNAWHWGNETERTEIERSWMEQLNSDPAWETKEKGVKSRLWLEYLLVTRSGSEWPVPDSP